jgi:abequosyltransferase
MENAKSIALSICIPVYNCAEFLGQALESILAQIEQGMEIVIYDGASTDGTETLVTGYLARSSTIRYHRAAARGGIDADLAACVGLARGEYCWLFSGDDVMRAGAIRRALAWMETGRDLYICEHTLCDKEMRFRSDYPVLLPNVPFTVNLADRASREAWFRRAVSTEAFFSFMSSLIVRRAKWLSGRLSAEFDGSCWGHVARLFEMIPDGLLVSYVAEVWLDQRGGNDSFRGSGIVKRYSLAIDGFDRISRRFFSSRSVEASQIRRVIRFEFDLKMFLDAKLLCAENPSLENKAILDGLVRKTYDDPSLGLALLKGVYWTTPIWSLRLARSFLRYFRRAAIQS